MAITDDLRKTFTDPTPLYFAAGTADLAFQQAKRVPELVEQLRAEAPARIEAMRRTDPKDVQDRAAARARGIQESVQSAVTEALGSLDTDLKKLGESAQGIALRGVGVAFEYAVKARETYERVAEHGEQAVRTWRGETVVTDGRAVGSAPAAKTIVVTDDDGKDGADTPHAAGAAGATGKTGAPAPSAGGKQPTAKPVTGRAAPSRTSAAKQTPAKKTTARRNGTKKDTPPAK